MNWGAFKIFLLFLQGKKIIFRTMKILDDLVSIFLVCSYIKKKNDNLYN